MEKERKKEKSYLLVLEVKFSLWKNPLYFCISPWNFRNLYGNEDELCESAYERAALCAIQKKRKCQDTKVKS